MPHQHRLASSSFGGGVVVLSWLTSALRAAPAAAQFELPPASWLGTLGSCFECVAPLAHLTVHPAAVVVMRTVVELVAAALVVCPPQKPCTPCAGR
jgi:hypothetical protein